MAQATKRRREWVYSPVIRFAIFVHKALGLRITTRGQEKVPATGGGVVAMNHIGYLDFTLAGRPFWFSHKRLVRFMAKDDVFKHPVSGPLMRGMHHIPVDRSAGAGAFKVAIEALQAGELIGVFPEATISSSYCLKDFKSGAVRMATEAGVPVIPLLLWGSQRVSTKYRRIKLRHARGVAITIEVLDPFVPTGDVEADNTHLHEIMSAAVDRLQREYPQTPRNDADRWWLPKHLGGTAQTLEEAAIEDSEKKEKKAAAKALKKARDAA